MRKTMYLLAVLIWILSAFANLESAVSQDTELSVLNHYEGNWSCEFSIDPQAEGGTEQRFKGEVKGKWFDGNKFMEQVGRYQLVDGSPLLSIKTLMSYDEQKKSYRYDYYTSSGDIRQSFGTWDDEKKTMTSTMARPGFVATIVADFSTPDIERWSIETKNSEGKVTSKIHGTNTRRKTR